jgi:hypothetical protein
MLFVPSLLWHPEQRVKVISCARLYYLYTTSARYLDRPFQICVTMVSHVVHFPLLSTSVQCEPSTRWINDERNIPLAPRDKLDRLRQKEGMRGARWSCRWWSDWISGSESSSPGEAIRLPSNAAWRFDTSL